MKSKYVMIAVLATLLAACSNDDENVATDGPVAAQVNAEINNRTVSRATATAWDTDDVIGLSTIDGTGADAPKTKYANVPYKYADSRFRFDETAAGKTQIYFEDTKEVTFRAYYPYKSDLADNGIIPDISTVIQADQKEFDYLFATGATASKSNPNVKFVKSGNDVGTSFHHCMSRLTFNFVAGDGVTSLSPLTDLKIEGVVNSGSFNITNGTATADAETDGNKDITIASVSGTNASVILFPQEAPMEDGQFNISLKLDGVSYCATLTLPTDVAHGAFTAGVNVAYTITIRKTGLTVNSAEISGWTPATGEGDATMEPIGGKTAEQAAIGDFYMNDGSLVDKDAIPTEEQKAACVGVVFWLGDVTAKDKTLKADHSGCTHGLVVALKDAIDGTTTWQDPYTPVQNWLNSNTSGFLSVASGSIASDLSNNIQGYNNTKAIEAFNADDANSSNVVQAVQKVVDYRNTVPAPAASSGWYLPSEKELTLLCGKDVTNIGNSSIGTDMRDFLNGTSGPFNKLGSSFASAILSDFYWSSTEFSDYSDGAFDVGFDDGRTPLSSKSNRDRVRCVLAF